MANSPTDAGVALFLLLKHFLDCCYPFSTWLFFGHGSQKKRPQQKAESSHFRLPTSVANRSFVSFPRSKDGKFDDYHYLGKFSQKGGKFDDYHYGRYNSPRRMASLMITIM